MSYPKYVYEQHHGVTLNDDETIDHIDNNFSNNEINNLQILSRADNISKANALRPAKWYTFVCPVCGTEAKKRMFLVQGNWNKGSAGPFCGRNCAAIFRNR